MFHYLDLNSAASVATEASVARPSSDSATKPSPLTSASVASRASAKHKGSRPSTSDNQNLQTNRTPLIFGTGFQAVDWTNLDLRQSMFKNGEELVKSNHIRNVTETRKPNCPVEIEAISIPQVKIRNAPYKIFMQLDHDRKIVQIECTCAGGAGIVDHIHTYKFWIS